jgi:hypothetical protein
MAFLKRLRHTSMNVLHSYYDQMFRGSTLPQFLPRSRRRTSSEMLRHHQIDPTMKAFPILPSYNWRSQDISIIKHRRTNER